MMQVSYEQGWVRDEERGYNPCRDGFLPANLTDRFASGSSSLGQFADLLNTSTFAEWPVATHRATISQLQLKYAETNAGWKSVYIPLSDVHEFENKALVRATAEKIERIRDVFGVSVSHLAMILRTSRPSVYTWLEGEEPRELFMLRIQQVCEYADRFSEMNPYHFSPGPLLRQPLGNAPSLLELLENEELILDDIELAFSTIIELMKRRCERMDRSKRRTGKSTASALDKEKNRRELTRIVGSAD